MSHADFKGKVNHASISLHYFWEHTAGIGHATMALRAETKCPHWS